MKAAVAKEIVARVSITVATYATIFGVSRIANKKLDERRDRKALKKIFEGFTIEEIEMLAESTAPSAVIARMYLDLNPNLKR